MNRIAEKFDYLRKMNKKALITFITAGDPDLAGTAELVKKMEKCGADLVELGIPYSDPIAEGVVIQRANERALGNGVKIDSIMEMVYELRKEVEIPILFLLYYNCILQYGPEKFFKNCRDSGVDGLIIPDLPFEEVGEIKSISEEYGVNIISMVSPVSKDRVEMIAKNAEGFIYCVSSLGVTGVRSEFDYELEGMLSKVREVSNVPTALGFGISNPEQAQVLGQLADGLIVGSALVKIIEESNSIKEAVQKAGDFVAKMKAALP